MTRSLYLVVSAAKSWKSWVQLTSLARFELRWWMSNLEEMSEFPIPQGRSTEVFSFEVAVHPDQAKHGNKENLWNL